METTITKHLTDGGIPSAWTPANLEWLAKAHLRHADHRKAVSNYTRAYWHLRWAALITDILESGFGPRH